MNITNCEQRTPLRGGIEPIASQVQHYASPTAVYEGRSAVNVVARETCGGKPQGGVGKGYLGCHSREDMSSLQRAIKFDHRKPP